MTDTTQAQDNPGNTGAGAGEATTTTPPATTPIAATTTTPPAAAPATNADTPLIDGGGTDADKTAASPSAFPDDWRQQMAKQLAKDFGGEEKILKQLATKASPAEVLRWAMTADKKIAKGEFKRPLPENATEEELGAWRKENGVPDTWDKYSTDLGNGVVFGENDKPVIDGFLEHAHKANMPQPFVKEALSWYHNHVEQQQIEQAAFDKQFKAQSIDVLKEEFGADFKGNLNAIKTLFTDAPEGLYNSLLSARTATGEKLGDHPDLNRWLVSLVRELNPAATVVGGNDPIATMDTEIAGYEKQMRTDLNGWHADKAAQARYQQLLEVRERQQKRAS
jgi:hypothetical protein